MQSLDVFWANHPESHKSLQVLSPSNPYVSAIVEFCDGQT